GGVADLRVAISQVNAAGRAVDLVPLDARPDGVESSLDRLLGGRERSALGLRRLYLAVPGHVDRARDVRVVALVLEAVVEDEQVARLEAVVARRAVRQPDAVDAHERPAVVAEVDPETEIGRDRLHEV